MLTDKNSPKSVIEQDPFVTNCFFCITSPHVHHTFIAHLGIGEMQFLSNTIPNICVFVLLTINYCTITKFFSFRRKCHTCPVATSGVPRPPRVMECLKVVMTLLCASSRINIQHLWRKPASFFFLNVWRK